MHPDRPTASQPASQSSANRPPDADRITRYPRIMTLERAQLSRDDFNRILTAMTEWLHRRHGM